MKRKYSILVKSTIVTAFLVGALFWLGGSSVNTITPAHFDYSNNPTFSSNTVITNGPSYFFPNAYASFSVTNPYAKYMDNFTYYISIDNVTWVQVPIVNTTSYTTIEKVPLSGFNFTLYQKIDFRTQDFFSLNQTIPMDKIINSFNNTLTLSPIPTPESIVISILLVIAVFSFILQIIDFLSKND